MIQSDLHHRVYHARIGAGKVASGSNQLLLPAGGTRTARCAAWGQLRCDRDRARDAVPACSRLKKDFQPFAAGAARQPIPLAKREGDPP